MAPTDGHRDVVEMFEPVEEQNNDALLANFLRLMRTEERSDGGDAPSRRSRSNWLPLISALDVKWQVMARTVVVD